MREGPLLHAKRASSFVLETSDEEARAAAWLIRFHDEWRAPEKWIDGGVNVVLFSVSGDACQ